MTNQTRRNFLASTAAILPLAGCAALTPVNGQPSKLVAEIDALTGAVEGIFAAVASKVPAALRADVTAVAMSLQSCLTTLSTAVLSSVAADVTAAEACLNDLLAQFPHLSAAVQAWVGPAFAIIQIIVSLLPIFTSLAKAPLPPGQKPVLPLSMADKAFVQNVIQPRIKAMH